MALGPAFCVLLGRREGCLSSLLVPLSLPRRFPCFALSHALPPVFCAFALTFCGLSRLLPRFLLIRCPWSVSPRLSFALGVLFRLRHVPSVSLCLRSSRGSALRIQGWLPGLLLWLPFACPLLSSRSSVTLALSPPLAHPASPFPSSALVCFFAISPPSLLLGESAPSSPFPPSLPLCLGFPAPVRGSCLWGAVSSSLHPPRHRPFSSPRPPVIPCALCAGVFSGGFVGVSHVRHDLLRPRPASFFCVCCLLPLAGRRFVPLPPLIWQLLAFFRPLFAPRRLSPFCPLLFSVASFGAAILRFLLSGAGMLGAGRPLALTSAGAFACSRFALWRWPLSLHACLPWPRPRLPPRALCGFGPGLFAFPSSCTPLCSSYTRLALTIYGLHRGGGKLQTKGSLSDFALSRVPLRACSRVAGSPPSPCLGSSSPPPAGRRPARAVSVFVGLMPPLHSWRFTSSSVLAHRPFAPGPSFTASYWSGRAFVALMLVHGFAANLPGVPLLFALVLCWFLFSWSTSAWFHSRRPRALALPLLVFPLLSFPFACLALLIPSRLHAPLLV